MMCLTFYTMYNRRTSDEWPPSKSMKSGCKRCSFAALIVQYRNSWRETILMSTSLWKTYVVNRQIMASLLFQFTTLLSQWDFSHGKFGFQVSCDKKKWKKKKRKKNLKQSWLPAFWKKIKTHKTLNRTLYYFYYQTIQDKMQMSCVVQLKSVLFNLSCVLISSDSHIA